MLARTIFQEEHELFRDQVRRFLEEEVIPHHAAWEEQGIVPREVWRKAGAAGLLCPAIPEQYGGGGGTRLHSAVLIEEVARAGASGLGFGLHSDIVAPYILAYGTEEQKKTWLPKMAAGEAIGAIAMTEPGAGSDLQSVRTQALREGDELVINGQKTFITNGQNADVVIVVTKTDPNKGAKGTTLVLVETNRPGFQRGRNLEKIGMKAQDTSELFFDNVRVPVSNILGGEGKGFFLLMQELAWERMQIAIAAVAGAEAALDWTLAYTKERKVFGQPVIDFQHNRFKLAEIKTEVQVARVFVDKLLELLLQGQLDAATAAMAKYWTTDLHCKIVDQCLQMFGGFGYMWEYPIARAFADTRVTRIYGGTNEIMKEIIGRTL
ncbi:acyl-CoA dehydrogenase family protein [Extensimonas vulgaris]|uniref:Acyl-[acyl-carrier-protein] dehydrogenase MbtN n=1 Tax=Extensimonas vulgaris TaxID=1031594 RepID=A0A369AK01_9BURK|nr:acyl-CoA dehydrogenase family protein [Extensimonas vulgaris]RCX09690.1 acyl-CoA dehydrogenase [Extensimonas vulgaris]TWI39320.1 acyl-CoA dehydrogenase [Extensimonas vulgaris]TXD15572.1 acyl-CoA dehydrogenase [Extensimonas vulgaris]